MISETQLWIPNFISTCMYVDLRRALFWRMGRGEKKRREKKECVNTTCIHTYNCEPKLCH